jgi:hypothetical protein
MKNSVRMSLAMVPLLWVGCIVVQDKPADSAPPASPPAATTAAPAATTPAAATDAAAAAPAATEASKPRRPRVRAAPQPEDSSGSTDGTGSGVADAGILDALPDVQLDGLTLPSGN